MKRLLWVEVTKSGVLLCNGEKQPEPSARGGFAVCWGNLPIDSKEFERWSGIRFPAPGIYGLEMKMAIVKKLRVVTTKDYVASERTKTMYVEDK